MLHWYVSVSPGHARPPCSACVRMARPRDWYPVPHDREHVVSSEKGVTSQSIAHACPLHDCDSLSVGHWYPPCSGSVRTERDRVWVPPPHEAVHVAHVLQLDVVQ